MAAGFEVGDIIMNNLGQKKTIKSRKSTIEDTFEKYFEDKFKYLEALYLDPLNVFESLTDKLVYIDNNGSYEETEMSIWNSIKNTLSKVLTKESNEEIFYEEITEKNFPLVRKAFELIIHDIGASNREESVIYKLRLTKQNFINLEHNLALLTEEQLEILCIGDSEEAYKLDKVKGFNLAFVDYILNQWYNSFESENVSEDKEYDL